MARFVLLVCVFERAAITVYGKAPLNEEDRIGNYEQPRWTAHRRFGETRGAQENSNEWTTGLSYSRDSKIAVGVETQPRGNAVTLT